ncbi:hypothetical protein AX774_g91 [Zancudomyces culisetae]|uniref:Uncharacterized protein n=1 Tax=Zancudomyces culisetae TaxID=1213189 RepID=A0A1R1PZE6_ZANCU|nr:hypothetical protein AX774_g91 [Zancudomyces culisetae]|eukprot:OMH86333.1 hypothetical protein AX774_g91 [Zancudomyces culisetae]
MFMLDSNLWVFKLGDNINGKDTVHNGHCELKEKRKGLNLFSKQLKKKRYIAEEDQSTGSNHKFDIKAKLQDEKMLWPSTGLNGVHRAKKLAETKRLKLIKTISIKGMDEPGVEPSNVIKISNNELKLNKIDKDSCKRFAYFIKFVSDEGQRSNFVEFEQSSPVKGFLPNLKNSEGNGPGLPLSSVESDTVRIQDKLSGIMNANDIEAFTFESWIDLIDIHSSRNKEMIIARVLTIDEKNPNNYQYSYYLAQCLNFLLFSMDKEKNRIYKNEIINVSFHVQI